jgi:hypothetical protein
VVKWSEFLAADLDVPGSIPGDTDDFLRSSESGTGYTEPHEYN